MHIVGVQMDSNEYLIPITPHPSCCLLADGECLLRRDLAFTKALNAVVAHHLATQPKPPLYGNHFGVGVLLGAVNTAYIHLAVGLIIVFSVRKCRI